MFEFCFAALTTGPFSEFLLLEKNENQDLKILYSSRFEHKGISKIIDSILQEVFFLIPRQAPLSCVIHPGPGSFTGIRIGVSLAQGLVRGRGGEVYAVTFQDLLNTHSREASIVLDGHNGFFAISQGGKNFQFVPYDKIAELNLGVSPTLYGYSQDFQRWSHLYCHSYQPINFENLNLAQEMAKFVITHPEPNSFLYGKPFYGLEAFTSAAR